MTQKIKLLDIVIHTPRVLVPISDKYWMLDKIWKFDIITNEFKILVRNQPGWITDKRSGSDWINWLVPKDGNDQYNAIIGFHDTSWSGWITRALSNELLAQGMAFSGEVSQKVSRIVKVTTDHFGHYYNFEDELPPPYTNNRHFERLTMVETQLKNFRS